MKKQRRAIMNVAIHLAILGTVVGQEEIVKLRHGKHIGADAVVSKEIDHVRNDCACKSFLFSIKQTGPYYVSAFCASPKSRNISVYIDDNPLKTGIFDPQNDGWQTCAVVLKHGDAAIPIYVSSGEHTLTFSYETDEVPVIDEIRLGKSPEDATVDRKTFFAWIDSLKTAPLPADYRKKKEKGTLVKESMTAAAPEYLYTGYLNQPCTYTYRQRFYLPSGTYTEFLTANPSPGGADPCMYLYSESNPGAYSWADDDGGGGYQSKIAVAITAAGWYTLIIRAYGTAACGAVDVLRDGTCIQRGATVAGTMYYGDPYVSPGLKNFFTCNPYAPPGGSDTYLWISQGYTSPFKAWNDDYPQSGGGAFNWGWFSRIASDNDSISFAFVSAYGTADNNVCDVYLGAGAVPDIGFPNLHPDDAMLSSGESDAYLSWGWAGGYAAPHHTSPYGAAWNPTAPYTGTPYYDSISQLASLDNFFGNVAANGTARPRYANAATYSRTGATPENAVIDVLGRGGFFTHAQIRKPANGHAHGYDWESKCDAGKRIFHPRGGLTGAMGYGDILYHYRQTGVALTDKSRSMGITRELTYEESKALGLTVSAPVATLTAEEKKKLNTLLAAIPPEVCRKLKASYLAMNKKIKDDASFRRQLANPSMIKNNQYYKTFLTENKAAGNHALAWLFGEMLIRDNSLLLYLFEDVTFNEYKNIFDAIVKEHFDNCYAKDGALLEYSPWNSCVKLMKHILADKL